MEYYCEWIKLLPGSIQRSFTRATDVIPYPTRFLPGNVIYRFRDSLTQSTVSADCAADKVYRKTTQPAIRARIASRTRISTCALRAYSISQRTQQSELEN